MESLLQAFQVLLMPIPILWITLGVIIGCIVGAIPGLSGSMLLALTLPLTFYMKSGDAVNLLVAMHIGAMSGGLLSATLLRIPGTGAAIVTTFDGYPLAKSGKAGRAIGIGIFSSFIGGFIAWIFLVTLSPLLSKFALKFSAFEIFSIVLLALVMIVSVSQGSILRAVISGILGLLVGIPGMDPVLGTTRLIFGFNKLITGFSIVPVLIGLFGFSQILKDTAKVEIHVEQAPFLFKNMFLKFSEIRKHFVNFVRSSVIGTWIGVLPGVGANIASLVAYSSAKNYSKHPELFGKGSEEGIIASETANNASMNGALIPMLTLGIPGNLATAILLGALTLHGLKPGPLLFSSEPEVVYGIMATAFVGNIIMLIVMLGGSLFTARIITIPKAYLLPILIVFCVAGTYALNGQIFDVWVLIIFGFVGFFFDKANIPLGPFIIGLILSSIAEVNFRVSLMHSEGSLLPFFTRPISATFILVSFIVLGWSIYKELKIQKKSNKGK